jgi:L-alanine-DL-glutamate epimerase-like enolase superfamily enzyme
MVNDVLDIVQPDPQYSGGILEVKKIAMLADLYGKVCVPHGGMQDSTGLCLAANLQVTGASDIPYLEYDLYPPAYDEKVRDRILKEPIVMRKDGYVYIPDKPGLGVELDEEAVAKYIVL